jgi:3-deoxy-7-phosphoheptulonate synthase
MNANMTDWTPDSWATKPIAQDIAYADKTLLSECVNRLGALPPLVTSWEVEDLRNQLADAQEGKCFVLQGGDCAETLADCQPTIIANKLKILLQMSLVMILGARKPVVRIGRFAGQYAKPRSSTTETRDGIELPSYFGDLINHPEFTSESRTPDPRLLLSAYQHSALTLNFIRALATGGFADLHHPEYWDLPFIERSDVSEKLRVEHQRLLQRLEDSMRFMESLGEGALGELKRVQFFTSHEGLNLHYESAQTRLVPRNPGHYVLSTHMPWIGERTRQVDGAHVELFRGVKNPVGVKLGPKATGDEIARLIDVLNPKDIAGKLVLITRLGKTNVHDALPKMIERVKREGRRVLWVSDPMHGNTRLASSGLKTRRFDDILTELDAVFEVHKSMGTILGGVHFELTGDEVTECIGAGLTEEDLPRNYDTACDPRLNYQQSLELAFSLAHRLAQAREQGA